jgi:hypothetical protein
LPEAGFRGAHVERVKVGDKQRRQRSAGVERSVFVS